LGRFATNECTRSQTWVTYSAPMLTAEERENALLAADTALQGRKARSVSRFASIELRASHPEESAWEFASMLAVGLGAFVAVIAVWFY
jgi:hypothetical protein